MENKDEEFERLFQEIKAGKISVDDLTFEQAHKVRMRIEKDFMSVIEKSKEKENYYDESFEKLYKDVTDGVVSTQDLTQEQLEKINSKVELEIAQILKEVKEQNEKREKEEKMQDILSRAVAAALAERFGDEYVTDYIAKPEHLQETIEEYNQRMKNDKGLTL